jgi:hypothetical protein
MPYNPRAVVGRAASAYGANPEVLYHIGRLESGFRNVVNDWDINARNGTPSASWFQFIKPTFDAFSRQARQANPAAWEGVSGDWRDPMAQALTTAWAVTNGKGGHWATYQRALDAAKAKDARGQAAPRVPGAAPAAPAQFGLQSAGPSPIAKLLDEGSFLRGYMDRRASDPVATPVHNAPARTAGAPGGARSSGGVPARRRGETGQQYLDRILTSKFGLRHDPGNSQTTGGRHAVGSGHYRGTATDFGDARNDPAQLQAAEDYLEANAQALGLKLALYGADEDADHANHLHAETLRALRGGKR